MILYSNTLKWDNLIVVNDFLVCFVSPQRMKSGIRKEFKERRGCAEIFILKIRKFYLFASTLQSQQK